MAWQYESRQGLKAFIDGDNEKAVSSWRKAMQMAEAEKVPDNFDLGQMYYYLGKVLWDSGESADSILYLERAVRVLTASSPGHEQLAKAKYDLAGAYRQTQQEEKATALYQDVLQLDNESTWIPLKKAIANLHKVKLAQELKGEVLESLCDSLGIIVDGDNKNLEKLLISYYSDKSRAAADKFFHSEYDIFDSISLTGEGSLSSKIKVLSEYTKVKIDNFEIQNVEDTTRYFSLELTSEGDSTFAEVCSIDDIVDLFNELSESKRFCKILNKDSPMSSFYLLSEKTLDFLEESGTLHFVDLPSF
jgi:tetratricopeptide (TPR) repeat protein